MAFNSNITPGPAPLLWSNVEAAFRKINENFDEIIAATGLGITPVNFATLDTDVSPATSNAYKLGSMTEQWKSIHTAEWSSVAGSELNGLWAGDAQIKGIGLTVDLPQGSTVNGELIINPDKTFFKAAQVDSSESVVANEFSDTLNFVSGNGIQLNVDSGAESITIDNTGILTVADGLGISHTTVSGVATINNTGVRSLQSTTLLPTGRTLGAGINIDNPNGDNVKITNTGILDVQAGFGITVSTDNASGISTVSFSSGVAPQTAFTRFHIVNDAPGNDITSDSTADTFNINPGYGILLSNDPGTDTLTITFDQTSDIYGSVFGKDSSVIVNSDSNSIFAAMVRTTETNIALGLDAGLTNQGTGAVAVGKYAGTGSQGARAVAVGFSAGATSQGAGAVAIGTDAANSSQGAGAVAIGELAGGGTQGANAIAVGKNAGNGGSFAGSIILNAAGTALTSSAAGFYVNPIRSTANGRPLMYDTSTKELFSSNVLEFFGSTISTSDSSGLTVDVQATFNADIIVENDLVVANRLTLKGSRVINLSELKSLTAASTSFADFQSRIAALV